MKNSANAFAPSAVCWVAPSGITGGFSPGLVFGPVRGTSAGTVGRVGCGGATDVDEVDGGGTDAVVCGGVRVGDGAPLDDDVHAAQDSARNAVNVAIHRTGSSCPTQQQRATQEPDACGQRRLATRGAATRRMQTIRSSS